MQKIQTLSAAGDYAPQELEIMKERASALGRAGEQLQTTLCDYRQAQDMHRNNEELKILRHNAAQKLWNLMIQRELLGFVHDNEKWLCESYTVPHEIWDEFNRL